MNHHTNLLFSVDQLAGVPRATTGGLFNIPSRRLDPTKGRYPVTRVNFHKMVNFPLETNPTYMQPPPPLAEFLHPYNHIYNGKRFWSYHTRTSGKAVAITAKSNWKIDGFCR